MKIYTGNLVNDPRKTPKGKPVEESSLFIISLQTEIQIYSRKPINLSLPQDFLEKRAKYPTKTQWYKQQLMLTASNFVPKKVCRMLYDHLKFCAYNKSFQLYRSLEFRVVVPLYELH